MLCTSLREEEMFNNFRSYQLAKELYQKCERIRAKTHIKNQLDRASLSVLLNLSEGSGKLSKKDRARFYQISLGSLRETYAILERREMLQECSTLAAHIWKLIQNPGP